MSTKEVLKNYPKFDQPKYTFCMKRERRSF